MFSGGRIVAVGTPKEIFTDNEDILSDGLDLPLTAYVTKRLKEQGIDVNNDLTEEGFISAVALKYGGGK